jgi:transposase
MRYWWRILPFSWNEGVNIERARPSNAVGGLPGGQLTPWEIAMSLHPRKPEPVPEETIRVAHAALPEGNRYIRIRDELDGIYADETFAQLFPARGQPAEPPWRLALVTLFQFAEGLSDRQAADAVRSRIDWKYALSLELTDSGFDHTVLSEFRGRLLSGGAEQVLLDVLLEQLRARGLLKARGRQRTDSTHVLALVRALNRVELVEETLRHALNSLAVVAPDWLRVHAQPEWVERYDRRAEDDRLPAKKEQRQARAQRIGADGAALLTAIYAAEAPTWLREVPAVDLLRRVWVQNFLQTAQEVRWRTDEDGIPPSSHFISSPYDAEAHDARKRTTSWVGYKVHLTETCDDDAPHLITHVETTSAPMADGAVTPGVHQALQEKGLLPATHVVDTGYLDAELLVTSQQDYDVDLLGPVRPDVKWQAQAGQGFDAQSFAIDWEQQRAVCPQGRASISWTPAIDNRQTHVIKIKFSTADCGTCPCRTQCIHSQKRYVRRTITVRPKEHYLALKARRERAKTPEYAAEYAHRAGIEGTLSQGVRVLRLRRTRYFGLARTHLSHVLTAAGLNLLRIGDWLAGKLPAKTRPSPFIALMRGSLAA